MHTSTHTFTIVKYADPHLICQQCGQRVTGYIHSPGHEEDMDNWPCEHRAGIDSTCPSWGPVDGCRCAEIFGHIPHDVPAAQPTREGEWATS